jgi:hypothetical protein
MFRFHGNKLGIEITLGHQFGQVFDNMSLRRDRVSGNYIYVCQLHRLTHGKGNLYPYSFRHVCSFSSAGLIEIS